MTVIKKTSKARHRWLTSIILATQEAEIGRIEVQSQPEQTVCETLSRKNPSQKRAGGLAQDIGPGFKPQYCKKTINAGEEGGNPYIPLVGM
jgi:hypothetical protein